MTTTTRRNLLRIGTTAVAYAAGATIVTGGVALASQAKGETLSPVLTVLIERHRAAEAERTHHYAAVIEPAFARRQEAKKRHQERIDAIPHAKETGGVSAPGRPITFCSQHGNRGTAEAYLEMDADEPNRSADWNDLIDAARRFIKADDARNVAISALGEPPTFRDLYDMEEKAGAPVWAARGAIYDFPCTTFADFHAKLAWIEANDGMDGEDLLPLVMADVARIAKATDVAAQEGR